MAELRPNIVFHGRYFVRHLGICNQICVKLLKVMSGVIPSNLEEKRRLYLTPFSWGTQTRHTHTHRHTHTQTDSHTQTHTHTYDDSIRRNTMRCISPKKRTKSDLRRRRYHDYDAITIHKQCVSSIPYDRTDWSFSDAWRQTARLVARCNSLRRSERYRSRCSNVRSNYCCDAMASTATERTARPHAILFIYMAWYYCKHYASNHLALTRSKIENVIFITIVTMEIKVW